MTREAPAAPTSVCSEAELLAELARLRLQVQELQQRDITLAQAQDLNHALMVHLGEGVAVVQDGKVVFANAKSLEIFQTTLDAAIGSDLVQWIPPQARPQALLNHARRMLGIEEDRQREVTVLTAQGEKRWLDLRSATVTWRGRPAAMLVYLDITQRKAEAEELRRSEERYRQVVDNLSEGMIVIQGGRVTFCNAQAAEILHVPQGTVHGAFFGTWVHPDDLPAMHERVRRRSLGEAEAARTQFRVIGSDNVTRWLRSNNSTVFWEGKPATMAFFTDITDQLAMTEALRVSEERYKTVVEHVSEGMVVLQGTSPVYANPRALELVGRTREKVFASNIFDWLHPDDATWVTDRFQRRMQGEAVPVRSEFRMQKGDGSYAWVETSITLVEWDAKPASLIFLSDISHRKGLELELRNTLDERETVLQHSMIGIAFLSNAGRFRWANKTAKAIFCADDTTPLISIETLYPCRAEYLRVGAEVNACMLAGKDYQSELQMRRLDGRLFWAMLSGRALNPNETHRGTVWTVLDISERMALEKSLQRSMVERDAILNNTLVGISYNLDRRVQWVNNKYLEMTGFRREDVLGRSSRIFYNTDEEFEAYGNEMYAELAANGHFSTERQIARKNGEVFWVELSGRCVVEKAPEAGVIWTMLDITDRHRADEDMRDALTRQLELNALRSRFVSMTSHEFRTPLATIMSSAELLRYYGDRLSSDDKLDSLVSIEAAVQRMTRMLERVMLIGKSDADMMEFSPHNINLDKVCRDILSEAMAQVTGAMGQINYRFDIADPMGPYDETLLRHILTNLLSNAIKYSPQGQPIEFRVSREGKQTVFQVIDQGIGIPESEIGHLYENFHRAGNVGAIPGTGLGLSIVKKSVDAHGGTIAVRSVTGDDAEHGTCFTVRL